MVSRSDSVITRGEMNRAFEDYTAELNIRQGQVMERILLIEQTLTGVDQKINILDSHVSARMQSVEENAQNSSDAIPFIREEVRNLGMKDRVLETGVEEVQDNLMNVATNCAAQTTEAIRKAEDLIKEAHRVNGVLTEADRCVHNLNQRMEKVEEIKRDGQNRGLLDPKHMSVSIYDGKGKEKFTDWRETLEKMVNEVHRGLRSVLRKFRADKCRITEIRIKEVINDLDIDGESIRMDFQRVNYELGAYLLTKLDDQPKLKAESVKLAGGFEMYRVPSQRYDRITLDHESLMLSEISKMAGTQASSLKDLANKMLVLESKIEAYQLKLGKEPEPSLLGSILTAILDPQTRREFVNQGGFLGDYEKMKERIDELSGNCGGAVAMDIGALEMECPQCTPAAPSGAVVPELDEGDRKPGNPNIQCWSCNGFGHYARDCPMNPKGGKAGSKGGSKGGKGGQFQGKGMGKGWPSKGGGKGKGTKGKGTYSLEQADGDWWGNHRFEPEDGGLRTLAALEKNDGGEKFKGKYYSHLDMVIDYDSDEEDSGLSPRTSIYHPCMDGPLQHIDQNDDYDDEDDPTMLDLEGESEDEVKPEEDEIKGSPWFDGEDPGEMEIEEILQMLQKLDRHRKRKPWMDNLAKQLRARSFTCNDKDFPPLPVAPGAPCPKPAPGTETLRGSAHLMKSAWAKSEATQKKNEDLLSGNKFPQWDQEELQAREKTRALRARPAEPEDFDEWTVKVSKSKKRLRKLKTKQSVNLLISNKREINEVSKYKGEWEPVELTVDSGAADTVCPPDTLNKTEVDASGATQDGFTVAVGKSIPNLGSKAGVMATQEWSNLKGVSFQLAPVHKTLLSVSQMIDNNHRVVFDKEWSYLEDKTTGEKTTLVRRNGLFVLQAWVRPRHDQKKSPEDDAPKNEAPFHRPGF